MLDWMRLDRDLLRALSAWRAASASIARAAEPAEIPCPIPERLVHAERIDEVAAASDPLAPAFARWLRALGSERRAWNDRVELARAWQRRVVVLEQERSLRELRRELLKEGDDRRRAALGRALADHSAPLADVHIAALERRRESGDDLLAVHGFERGLAPALAASFLRRTADAGSEIGGGWIGGARAAIGSEASEGWPAQLRVRWFQDVFAPGFSRGLALDLASPPPAWGASSFARALGGFGAALLEAARPATLPLALHRAPRGIRRQERYALFAGLVVEPAFSVQVLGLGRPRAKDQTRLVGRAFCASLRFDALRVVLLGALDRGERALREAFAETTQAMFRDGAPDSLCAVLPQLRPTDAAAFVGTLLSVLRRDELVARHDEDWFRNPRAAEELRAGDARPEDGDALDPQHVEQGARSLVARLEAMLS